jgi:hypothetical protein
MNLTDSWQDSLDGGSALARLLHTQKIADRNPCSIGIRTQNPNVSAIDRAAINQRNTYKNLAKF